jgi:hypothetical protein
LRAFVGKELRGESVPVLIHLLINLFCYDLYTTPEDVRFEFIDKQENASSVESLLQRCCSRWTEKTDAFDTKSDFGVSKSS